MKGGIEESDQEIKMIFPLYIFELVEINMALQFVFFLNFDQNEGPFAFKGIEIAF